MFWLKNKISFVFLVKYKKIKGGEKDKNFFILCIYFFYWCFRFGAFRGIIK